MNANQSKGLGRGFESLIPQNFDDSILAGEDERIHKIATSDIEPNTDQPRTTFDQEALKELASSIKRHGILQPLVITQAKDGKYRIVAGERRWRAAKLAHLDKVPALVRTAKELEQLEIALVENVQRVDLSPLEQAVSIQRLHEQFNIAYEEVANRLGKAATTIHNIVRLLALPGDALEALRDKKITEGHARAILALKDTKQQTELLNLIKSQGWSVRQAERYVTAHKQGAKDSQSARAKVATSTPETQKLSELLKTTVTVRRTAKGGKLEIGFGSDSELKRLIKRISS